MREPPTLAEAYSHTRGLAYPIADASLIGRCYSCGDVHAASDMRQMVGPLTRYYFCPATDDGEMLAGVLVDRDSWFIREEMFSMLSDAGEVSSPLSTGLPQRDDDEPGRP